MLRFPDLVGEAAVFNGDTLALSGEALRGLRAFSDAIAPGDSVYVLIANAIGTQQYVVEAVFTPGVLTITRSLTTVGELSTGERVSVCAVAAGEAQGLPDHGALSGLADDDHPQYLTEGRGDTRYDPIGKAQTLLDTHEAAADPHPAYLTSDEAEPAGTAQSLLAAHEAAPDPHPAYLTRTEGDVAYEPLGASQTLLDAHEASPSDPHAAAGYLQSVVAGENVAVDATDPRNPVVSAAASGGGSSVVVSSTPPADPAVGDLWYDNADDGRLFIWNGAQWVDAAPAKSGTAGTAGSASAQKVLLSTMGNGVMGDGQTLLRYVALGDEVFPAGLATSHFLAEVAATAETVLPILLDGVQVGTITIPASGTTGAFAAAADITPAAGEVIKVTAPATADATLADWAMTIAGERRVGTLQVTGGTIVDYTDNDVDYRAHIFYSDGEFVVANSDSGIDVDYLIVGGGGSGAHRPDRADFSGGGGGGGGVLSGSMKLIDGTYSAVVGPGGELNKNGGNSSFIADFINLTARGGGFGRLSTSETSPPGEGGNGGGGCKLGTSNSFGGFGTEGQGHAGGQSGELNCGGGGGGSGTPRTITTVVRNGGEGISSSITGTMDVYGSGGGGGRLENASNSVGGTNGGNGGTSTIQSTPGVDGTGGGGGGGGEYTNGSVGGSGIVVIRYTV